MRRGPVMGPRTDIAMQADEIDAIAMGARVRATRQALGFSTAELAVKAGLSTGLISQIERGQANPSLRTLERLRTALGVSLMVLLEGSARTPQGDPAFVRRAAQRPRLAVGDAGLVKHILSPPDTDGLRFMLITVPSNARSIEVQIGEGQKAGVVLKGSISLRVGDRQAHLRQGDSFQFEATIAHAFSNETTEDAELLWIMVGPSNVTHV